MVEKRRMERLGEVDVERRWRGMEGRARVLLEPSTACFRGMYEFGLIQGGVVVFRDDKRLANESAKWGMSSQYRLNPLCIHLHIQ